MSEVRKQEAIDKDTSSNENNLHEDKVQQTKKWVVKNASASSVGYIVTKTNVTNAVYFNEEETKHYFNAHLDQLQHNERKDRRLNKEGNKIWIPSVILPCPVISVTACLKPIDSDKLSVSGSNKINIQNWNWCDNKSGTLILHCPLKLLRSKENHNNFLFNISKKSVQLTKQYFDKGDASVTDYVNIFNMLKSTRQKKQIKALKLFFNNWIQYVKYCKTKRLSKKFVIKKRICNNCVKSDRKMSEFRSQDEKKSEDVTQGNVQSFDPNEQRSKQNINKKVTFKEKSTAELVDFSSLVKHKTESNDQLKNITEGIIKTVKRSEVDSENTKPKKISVKRVALNIDQNKVTKTENSKPYDTVQKETLNQNYLKKRDTVQEKTSADLKGMTLMIEKQNKIIKKQNADMVMLQKTNCELRTKLELDPKTFSTINQVTLTSALRQLALNSGQIKNQTSSIQQHVNKAVKLDVKNSNYQDFSRKKDDSRKLRIMQTGVHNELTKVRIADEKTKSKFQLLEKKGQNINKQKREQPSKVELEKQIAEENARNTLAKKIYLTNATYKATNHYKYTLLKKAFTIMRSQIFAATMKSSECVNMYNKKLLTKMYTSWKQQTCQSVLKKNNLADTFYNKTLMRQCWNTLHMVRNPDIMIKSKL